jgi:hypothetical protein
VPGVDRRGVGVPLLIGAALGALIAWLAPLTVVAIVVVGTILAALLLAARQVERGRRAPAPTVALLAVGLAALVVELVVLLGLVAGIAVAVVLIVALVLFGGDLG